MAGIRYIVTDVERAVAFYTTHCGFSLRHRDGTAGATVGRGDVMLWLSGPESADGQPLPAGGRPEPGGRNRIIIEVPNLATRVTELRSAGVAVPVDVVRGPGGNSAVIEDPDGNQIELLERKGAPQPTRPAPLAAPAPAVAPASAAAASAVPPRAPAPARTGTRPTSLVSPRKAPSATPPNSAKIGAGLFLVALLVGAVDLYLQSANVTRAEFPEVETPTGYFVGAFVTIAFVVLILLRANWARWVFCVLSVLAFPLVIPILLVELEMDQIGAGFTIIQVVLQAIGVALLFQRSANEWFRSK